MIDSAEQTMALRHYLEVVRRRKWVVIGTMVVVPLAALLISLLQSPVYEGSAKVLLSRQNLASRLTGIPESNASVEEETVIKTQAEVARVPAIARAVARKLRSMTPEEFLDSSSVSTSPEAEILTFRVRNGDQEVATRAATAYAHQYSRYRHRQDTASLVAARKGVERHVQELQESGEDQGSLYSSLLNREQQLQTIETLQTSNTHVIEAARKAPQVAPNPVRNTIIGLFVGVAVGLGIAFLLEALDTRVRNAREVERRLGMPLLARIPRPPKGASGEGSLTMLSDPHAAQAEAFRILRTNVEFTLLDRDVSSIMVTSALEEEGKSTTASNLALAYAQAGKRIALVDLDLRRPRLGQLFELDANPGVVQVVLGDVSIDEAVHRVPVQADTSIGSPVGNGSGAHLEVLTSGSPPPNPGEFVASRRLPEMLARLCQRADLVIIDSPPLLHVGDAMTLSADVDALIVVAMARRLRQGSLDEAKRLLTAMRAHHLGFVLAGTEQGVGYGYGDAYGYRSPEPNPEQRSDIVT